MEFATGAMSSLLPKLGELLMEEYKLQEGLKKGIRDLMDELVAIQAALEKVSHVPLDQLNPLVKIWANDARGLSYAIEDNLDSFMVRVEGVEPTKPQTFLGFIKKIYKMATKLNIRREIANDIKDAKIQVREVKERYGRYKDIIGSSSAKTEIDPRLLSLYDKVSDLVGINEAIEDVMALLCGHTEVSKTISIVGFGGLGKTTLAKVVYAKLNKKFDCGVFVPVGQNADPKKIMRDILLELDRQKYMNITASEMDVRQLIDEVRKFLGDKRYFIVIDDIWDIQTWEILKRALVDSNSESRIITTTRIVDVAKKVGGVYNMKPLSNVHSKCLFDARTGGGEGVSSSNQPTVLTNKILKKCGGVPLSIITIASLLVGKQCEDWSKVYDAIGFGNEDNEVVHNTRKILSFSYYDLHFHLKTCLLYLSMFPEDSFIEKHSLIWRWVSEGFVEDRERSGSFELGEIYFNELVNKSMIRLIEPDENSGGPCGCRVHDMVLDLIRTISNEVNFVTVHDMEHDGTCSRGKPTNKVRRLALHGRSMEHNTSIEIEYVRTLNGVMCSDIRMPLLWGFKVLRVLVIEDCNFLEGHSLDHLGKLVHLRYLGLVRTAVKLPEGIGHDLKFLEILDVRGGLISELPPSVGELMNLKCLQADGNTLMKGDIGKLTHLEELKLTCVEKYPNFLREVGKLTKLRFLHIRYDEMEEGMGKALAESLCNLHEIRSLNVSRRYVHERSHYLFDLGGSLEDLAPSPKLCLLHLVDIAIPKMPSCIKSMRFLLLSKLNLRVEAVEPSDVQTLGRLPSLLSLILWSEDRKDIPYTFGRDEFQKLIYMSVKKVEITIGEGALPMLEGLGYSASVRRKDVANSLSPWTSSCPLLESVVCYLDCADSGYQEIHEVKEALSQALNIHPNVDLILEIQRHNYAKEAAKFVDKLEWVLCGLDGAEDVGLPAYQESRIRRMVTSLEDLLLEAAEPRVGRYGEQDIRGFVTKFKSLLHDDAGSSQEETDTSDASESSNQDDDIYFHHKDDDANAGTDQEEEDSDAPPQKKRKHNDAATSSSGDHQEERGSRP